MRNVAAILSLMVGYASFGLAQPASPPRTLPPSLDDPKPTKPPGPLSPAEAAKQREQTIRELKEDLLRFEPQSLTAEKIEGHWLLRSGKEHLKDFGPDRATAQETAKIIQDLRFNQIGIVAGSNPPFEYWLIDGKAARAMNARLVVLPIASANIHAEKVGGTWMVTDGAKGLYDFGTDEQGAKRAAIVFWKYGFNQLAVIGNPQPTLFIPLLDPRQVARANANTLLEPSPLRVLSDAARTSLLLPGDVYAGPKAAFNPNQLSAIRQEKSGEWTLVLNNEIIGRFGSNETTARAAIKVIQDAKPTEVAFIGESRIPLFLNAGQAIHGEPLGVPRISMRADRMKVQKLRDNWWLFEDTRPVIEIGSKIDAELMLGVIRVYELKNLSVFGKVESGGLKVFTAGR